MSDPVVKRVEGGMLRFWCPGCDESHMVRVEGQKPGWAWNGSSDKPTFSPSILVRGVIKDLTDDQHRRIMAGEKINLPEDVCHSFVTDGRIQFLGDCTHKLAGQTVDLPPIGVADG